MNPQSEMDKKHKILIIDDEKPLLLGLKALMRRNGYEVFAAEGGQTGLDLAKSEHPDLIICDVMMPPPDGFKLRELLGQDPETSAIPFIFLTAHTGQEEKLIGLTSGADDYITKPFDKDELLLRVKGLLRRSSIEREIGRSEMERQAEEKMENFKHEVLQNLHHEMRTPMVNILMPLEAPISEKFGEPEEKMRFLDMAVNNAHRLHGLLEDMIMLSNIDHGNFNTIRQSVDTEGIKSMLRQDLNRYVDKQLDVAIHFQIKGELYAPRNEYKRACLHLADNAFKFSQEGGRVEIVLRAPGDGSGEFMVRDYGPGIPPEFSEKVFERFFQVSQGTARHYEGLGVGLTIARAVARALEGDVGLLPVDQGTLVRFWIPPGADHFQNFSQTA